ncbi:MAG: 30S ribosomal protein S9 [Anaerolineaceae bacterium]|nr:30S ribosomal protein S9 [Anaerolineaceae bacterium]
MAGQYIEGVGRRKESIARVRVSSGTGIFTINNKELEAYFGRTGDMEAILSPMKAIGQERSVYDVTVLVKGGGVTGQTDSVKLGLARALAKMSDEYNIALRKENLLSRDPRIKERKKPGLKRARKAPTYTKR